MHLTCSTPSKYASLHDCVYALSHDVNEYYEAIRALTGNSGISWDSLLGGWLVTSYQLCSAFLQTPEMSQERLTLPKGAPSDLLEFVEKILNAQLMFSKPQENKQRHGQWTSVLHHGLDGNPANFKDIARHILETHEAQTEIDLYGAILQPYASKVVAGQLGISETERNKLYPFIVQYARFLDGKIRDEKQFHLALYSIVCLYNELGAKRAPSLEFLGYSKHEWVSDYILATVAGHESTAYLLTTVFTEYAPQQSVNRTELMKLIWEALRFDSPIQLIGRRLTRDLRIEGIQLKRGDKVFFHIGAANRDPTQFPNPDVFQLERSLTLPLSFGVGEGRCVGRNLVISSTMAMLETLLERGEWFHIDSIQSDHGIAGRGCSTVRATRVQIDHTVMTP